KLDGDFGARLPIERAVDNAVATFADDLEELVALVDEPRALRDIVVHDRRFSPEFAGPGLMAFFERAESRSATAASTACGSPLASWARRAWGGWSFSRGAPPPFGRLKSKLPRHIDGGPPAMRVISRKPGPAISTARTRDATPKSALAISWGTCE